jgi:YebC/PmpR family DNA-binding regulatory protein
MSGHSHWAGIKHKKAKEDARRGKEFSKLSKTIMGAARRGGKDMALNLELQYAVDAARAGNMHKDTIERAILKGVGELEGEQVEPMRLEGYGFGGAAVIVEAITGNRNRTASNIRRIFDGHGAKLGASGCVSWSFQRKGLIILSLGERSEEEVFDVVVDAGAEDFQKAGDSYELTCPVTSFASVTKALENAGVRYESAEITEVPTSYVDLSAADGRRMLSLMEELEDDEDVVQVHSNFNLPAELVAELSKE